MPCVEGELCLQQGRTPQAPHGHVCKGGYGGRLHGNCGSVFDDSDQNRICSTYVTRTGTRRATAAEGAGTGPSKRARAEQEGFSCAAAEDSGNGDTVFHLSKAKMAMIAAHAAKGARQEDMRECVAATE